MKTFYFSKARAIESKEVVLFVQKRVTAMKINALSHKPTTQNAKSSNSENLSRRAK